MRSTCDPIRIMPKIWPASTGSPLTDVTVYPVYIFRGNLDDIARKRPAPVLAFDRRYRSLVLNYVHAVLVEGQALENRPQVHPAHAQIGAFGWIMVDEPDLSRERHAVIVDVEGTHEDSDQNLR